MPRLPSEVGNHALHSFRIAEWLVPSLRGCTSIRFASNSLKIRRVKPGNITERHDQRPDAFEKGKRGTERRQRFKDDFHSRSSRHVRFGLAVDAGKLRPGSNSVSVFRGDTNVMAIFRAMVGLRIQHMADDLLNGHPVTGAREKIWGVKDDSDLEEKLKAFELELNSEWDKAKAKGSISVTACPVLHTLRQAFVANDERGLRSEILYAFKRYLVAIGTPEDYQKEQKKIADLRFPLEWYPATRAEQRTIHLHVGPTNSGKTYHALQRLEAAQSGVYAGPLRLLAHEVYTRLNAKGKVCALVTGEERRIPPKDEMPHVMSSCTVEMVPLNTSVDVAVIDEIQMIGDPERGWAWTQAVLGLRAKELHLCGETRVVPLIKELCAMMGDKVVVHEYERLNPLFTSDKSLDGKLDRLEKGDAVILFSRVGIHAMKKEIEESTGKRCAIIYGSLPPETRAQQANLFNDPDNDYDILVASDAIGMGLNLSINRVVFEATARNTGFGFRVLEPSSIKQIAGRAGRFKAAHNAIKESGVDVQDGMPDDRSGVKMKPGFVTTLTKTEFKVLKDAMQTEVRPLNTAGLLPPTSAVARFAAHFPPDVPLSYILLRLKELGRISGSFHYCIYQDALEICDIIQDIPLALEDRIVFTSAPMSIRDPSMREVLRAYATCVAEQSSGELLSISALDLDLLDQDIDDDVSAGNPSSPAGKDGISIQSAASRRRDYLDKLESLHRSVTLYLWLSYRFAGVFRSQALAFQVKKIVEERIEMCLDAVSYAARKITPEMRARKRMLLMKGGPKHKLTNGEIDAEVDSSALKQAV